MRITAISNLYPPHAIGGYEHGCKDVLEGLAARGHQVCVLTSTYGAGETTEKQQVAGADSIAVHRKLHLHWENKQSFDMSRGKPWRSLWELAGIERNGLAAFRSVLREFRPDVLSLWNMGGLSESLVTAVQESGVPGVFHISDEWPGRLGGDPWLHFWCRQPQKHLKRAVKSNLVGLLRKVAGQKLCFQMPDKRFHTCQFVSDYLRQSLVSDSLQVDRSEVIHWGVQSPALRTLPSSNGDGVGLSLLYLGQMVPHKGPHIALEALSLLKNKRGCGNIHLTLAGTTPQPDYLLSLQKLIEEKGLSSRVKLLASKPRKRLADFCQQYDALLFTSIWEEPFSIVLLEAMGAGLPVIATSTGGTPEVIRDRENGLLCRPNDPVELAGKIEALAWNRSLRHALAESARESVRGNFNFNIMLDKVEKLLLSEGG